MSKKARDLLPPDGPDPVRAEDVRPADDDLDVEVETRKIGIRRVSSLDFADRISARTRWRPAGNSRRFWRQIEADDPFKKRPARPTDAPLELYPAQRIERVEGSLPKPQPEVAKASTIPRRSSEEAPKRPRQPVREQPRPRAEPPEPVHTPEPRTARPPVPQPEPEPPPTPPQPEPPQAQHRRLPPKPPNQGRSRSGRQRMPSRAGQAVYGKGGKTAAEIREEKRKQRKAGTTQEVEHPIKQRSLDALRETMKNLMFHQQAFEAGEENLPEIPHIDELDGGGPRKVKGEVKRRAKAPKGEVARRSETRAPPPPQPAAPSRPAPPPVDRTPPKPKPKPEAPIDRSPSAGRGGNGGGLDDLFGGGGDRVRIGRRSKKSSPEGEGEG